MTKHFPLSPSAAARWLACPGSLNHPADNARASAYADEGTAAHARGSQMVFDALATSSKHVQANMDGSDLDFHAWNYACYCVEKVTDNGAEAYGIEETLESRDIPGFGGTPDFYCGQGPDSGHAQTAYIVDFKYGAGVSVAAERNPQLLSYAALLLEKFPHIGEFELTIYQPRTSGPAADAHRVSATEVREFAERIKATAEVPPEQRTYVAGDHCRWCPAIATCDVLHGKQIEAARVEFSESDAEQLAKWNEFLAIAPTIKPREDAIKSRMLDMLKKGLLVPGWKAVKALGNRAWIVDDEAAIKALAKKKLGKKVVCEAKLKSPSQLDREGYGAEIVELVGRRDNGFTVVSESDKRPAVVFETAEETFDDLSFLD